MISDETPSTHPGPPIGAAADGHNHVARVVMAVAIVTLAVAAVYLRTVLLLAFGSIIIAVVARTASQALRRGTGWSDRISLAVVVVGTLAVLAVSFAMMGEQIGKQFAEFGRALPAALEGVSRWLDSHVIGSWLVRWWNGAAEGVEWSRVASVISHTVGAIGSALLIVVVGLYLAADPQLYRRGLLHLLPQRHRARTDLALCEAGNGLSRWLMGQGISMLIVGGMTTIGLALIGVPLALPLGIIAGLLEFVPFFGTLGAGALIVLLASTQGATQMVYAAFVCIFVQQIESYVVAPFVQRWAIALPPALGLMSVVVFGALLGPLGVVFAVPLMVVLMLLVQRLYVDGALGEHEWPVIRGTLNCQLQRQPRVPSAATVQSVESLDE